MKYFLTSYPVDEKTGKLFEKNHFRERFLLSLGESVSILFIASDPNNYQMTEFYARDMVSVIEKEGVAVKSLSILDGRNKGKAASLFKKSNLVILSGGHTPTQNKFFSSFPLKLLISNYKGTILGISAGSMNSGKEVYLMPEEEGETESEECNKLAKGLGITSLVIIPHYKKEEDDILDGLNLYKNVVCPFFRDRAVMCIPDGSYIYNTSEGEAIAGECWTIYKGKRNRISIDEEEIFVEKE